MLSEMCGIAGLVLGYSRSVKSEEVSSLFQRLNHRGANDTGLLYHHQGKVDLKPGESFEDFVADGSSVNEERWIDIVGTAAYLVAHKVKPKEEWYSAADLRAFG